MNRVFLNKKEIKNCEVVAFALPKNKQGNANDDIVYIEKYLQEKYGN